MANKRKVYNLIAYCCLFIVISSSMTCCMLGLRRNNSWLSSGLNLISLFPIVKQAKTGSELERLLNTKGGVNNLDLNGDGVVDFIKVTEYGNRSLGWGFSLTTEPAKGQIQEIASIEMIKSGTNSININIQGNRWLYRNKYCFTDMASTNEFQMWGYFHNPGYRPYSSPFNYGRYPGYYGNGFHHVSGSVYQNRIRNINMGNTARPTTFRTMSETKLNNPNRGKTAKTGINKGFGNTGKSESTFGKKSGFDSSKKSGSGSSSKGGFGRPSGFSGFGR